MPMASASEALESTFRGLLLRHDVAFPSAPRSGSADARNRHDRPATGVGGARRASSWTPHCTTACATPINVNGRADYGEIRGVSDDPLTAMPLARALLSTDSLLGARQSSGAHALPDREHERHWTGA